MKPRALVIIAITLVGAWPVFAPTVFSQVLQAYANPTKPDSSDNDPSLLGKMLLMMQSTAYGAASQGGAANWLATPGVAGSSGNTMTPARVTRRSVLCMNLSSEAVYINSTPGVTATTGGYIAPGQGITLRTTAAIYWFSADGAAKICAFENYD